MQLACRDIRVISTQTHVTLRQIYTTVKLRLFQFSEKSRPPDAISTAAPANQASGTYPSPVHVGSSPP